MGTRHYVRRIAVWSGIASCALVVVVWAMSIRACWATNLLSGHARLSDGALFYYYRYSLPPGLHRFDTMGQFGFRLPIIRLRTRNDATVIVLPLWVLFSFGCAPIALSVIRSFRSRTIGHCGHCNYDLTGNTSGTCPECGNPCADNEPRPRASSQ
jgi:hypothetical protein